MQFNDHHTLKMWFYRVGRWIFPSLSELQIALLYGVGAGFLILHWTIVPAFAIAVVELLREDSREIFFLIIVAILLGTPLVAILKPNIVPDSTKLLASVLYFVVFAIIAMNAWDSAQLVSGAVGSFAWFNLWLIRITLGLAVARGILATLIMRTDDPELSRFVTQNFRDTQYRLAAFVVTGAIGIMSVLILRHFYSDELVVASLSLAYSGVAVSLLSNLRISML